MPRKKSNSKIQFSRILQRTILKLRKKIETSASQLVCQLGVTWGRLFQNRYMSEAVETEIYFLTILRYIHQNPVRAGIVIESEDYQWSSYEHYNLYYQGQNSFVNLFDS